MAGRAPELRGVEVVHLYTEGEAPYARPERVKSFHTSALSIGARRPAYGTLDFCVSALSHMR